MSNVLITDYITNPDIENNVLIDQSMAGTYFRAFWEKQYNGLIE